MKFLLSIVAAFLIAYTIANPTRVRRQGFNWGDEDETPVITPRPTGRPTASPTPRPPNPTGPTTTTATPEFETCIRSCPALPQYNPVCGTNRVTYHNVDRLNCAARCGLGKLLRVLS